MIFCAIFVYGLLRQENVEDFEATVKHNRTSMWKECQLLFVNLIFLSTIYEEKHVAIQLKMNISETRTFERFSNFS